jgi:hypothetical protein
MHKLLELLFPTKEEAIFYPFGALLLLGILNSVTLWNELLNAIRTDPATTHSISEGLRGFLERYTTLSNPQVVNSVVWALTGGLAFVLVVALLAFVNTLKDDRNEVTFIERFGIRLLALGALVVLAILTLTVVLPLTSRTFVRTAVHMTAAWYNVFEFIGSILLMALCLYVAAVLCRLVVLRLRVFSTVID